MFSGVMELNCALMIGTPRGSFSKIWFRLMAAPMRKSFLKAVLRMSGGRGSPTGPHVEQPVMSVGRRGRHRRAHKGSQISTQRRKDAKTQDSGRIIRAESY